MVVQTISHYRIISKLGARYVMQGSLRQAGSMLRVAVQLLDAETGAHLWAEWVAPYLVATAYVSLGRRSQAFEWLQKGREDYDEWIDCINIDPALDLLRSDPRFQDLLRRVDLPQ